MCGIFGWIKPKATMETELNLVKLFRDGLAETQERGHDATGFYAPNIGLVKEAIEADEFVVDNVPESLKDERFVIGHCRAASAKYLKDEKNLSNLNNAQPFETKNFVSVHNGTINTPRLKNYPYVSDIDSENIIAYSERTGVRNALASIDAGSAVVIYDKKNKKIFFWTNGERPLSICLYQGMIFFASTRKILQKVLKPKVEYSVFPDINYATLYEHELLEFDLQKNKFTRKGEIKAKVSKAVSDETKSRINGSHFTSISAPSSVTNLARPLAKGCVSNPSSQQTVLQLPPPAPDSPYGRAAREAAASNLKRVITVGPNGIKTISYQEK